MISFEDAMDIICSIEIPINTHETTILQALGKPIINNVLAAADSPEFDKSAMDGYACRIADLANAMQMVETIAAGSWPSKQLKAGQCAKIMTGAALPQNAETVFMVEESRVAADGMVSYTGKNMPDVCEPKSPIGSNIRFRGEDCAKGDIVLRAGTRLRPAHISILAAQGISKLLVQSPPRVAVICTGTELIEPGQKLNKGQIHNSNGSQMMAQLANMGIQANYLGIAPDTPQATRKLIDKATTDHDLILLSGGVSMGDFDYVPDILDQLGYNIHFRKVAVQPGKPTLFAQKGDTFCFGLPGNPVSAFVQFELMVHPFIGRMSGYKSDSLTSLMPLGSDFGRKKTKRMSWIPIRLHHGQILPLNYNGSGHINSLAMADGLIAFGVGVSHLKKGELVNVRLI